MLFTGSGRHRRQSQAEKTAERAIAAAGVAGVGIALPLLAVTSAHAAPSALWDRVADCESGGNWSSNAGDGLYGGLQINAQRWSDYGGTQYAPLPDGATRSEQIAVAERILATEGPQAWSSCADAVGLNTVSAPGVVDDNDSADETGSLRGARGAAAVNTSVDGTTPAGKTDPVFSGLPGYDPIYHVYWYEKNGGWFWTSHQSLYERYMQLTHPQPVTTAPAAPSAPVTTAPTTPTTAPVSPVTPVTPVLPIDPTAPTTTPTPGAPTDGDHGNGDPNGNGNGNGNNGGGNGNGGSAVAPTTPSAPPSTTAPAPDPTVGTAPAPASSTATTSTPTAPAESATPAAAPYTVGPGDTLAGIARSNDVSGGWSELYRSNQQVVGGNPDLIHPGQVLKLG